MSQPQRARRDGNSQRRPDLAPDDQLAGGSVPEPEKPATPPSARRPVRHLTDDEIFYFVARDPDKFFEEDFYRWVEWDRAIDREPELE